MKLSHSQEESSSCKKEHERYQSECGNETISDDMRNDDAAVKVCVDQHIKSGGKNLKSSRNRLSLNRKKKPIVIPEDKDTIEKNIKSSPLRQKTTKSTRKLRKKKVPYTPSVKPKMEEHCICHLDYQSVDNGRMIQCQNCQTWYHCSCLSLPQIPTTVTGKQTQFRCGRLFCNGGGGGGLFTVFMGKTFFQRGVL